MAITTLNNRSINRSDTASADQVWTATSATASDFQAAAAGGKIGQVVSVAKTDTTSIASSTFADIAGITVDITPAASSSKVLVCINLSVGPPSSVGCHMRLLRDSTEIAIGDADGVRIRGTLASRHEGELYGPHNISMMFLDSPSTTSATTYKIQWRAASGTLYLNRSYDNTDHTNYMRSISTITVQEVLA